jgi:putative membrane protein
VTDPIANESPERTAKLKAAVGAILAVSLLACALLLLIVYGKPHTEAPAWASVLPWVNAAMNALSATCLCLGVAAIRRKDIVQHTRFQVSAFAASSVFLVSYITYHWLHGDTKYLGPARGVYLAILASHIVLSVVALPMILATFFLSLTSRIALHRKLARFTFPIWLYVSVTGVIIVLMLKTLGSS